MSQENRAFKFIKDNWVIITFLGSLIVTWTNFNNAISDSQKRITNLESKVTSVDSSQTQILVQLTQIQTDVLWIKQRINK